MNNKYFIFTAIILAVVAGLVGGYYAGSSRLSAVQIEAPSADQPLIESYAEIKEISDDHLTVELILPPDLHLSVDTTRRILTKDDTQFREEIVLSDKEYCTAYLGSEPGQPGPKRIIAVPSTRIDLKVGDIVTISAKEDFGPKAEFEVYQVVKKTDHSMQ